MRRRHRDARLLTGGTICQAGQDGHHRLRQEEPRGPWEYGCGAWRSWDSLKGWRVGEGWAQGGGEGDWGSVKGRGSVSGPRFNEEVETGKGREEKGRKKDHLTTRDSTRAGWWGKVGRSWGRGVRAPRWGCGGGRYLELAQLLKLAAQVAGAVL